jgi:lipopolysaccharide/colanic/teichoic acid biosynthesis glycosyltransferase
MTSISPTADHSVYIEAVTARPRQPLARYGPLRGYAQFDAEYAVNAAIAVLALAILWPLFLLIALAIKLSSRGPIFYTQLRVGLDRRHQSLSAADKRRVIDYGGKLFSIYKFRTMTVAPAAGAQVWAAPNDSRVTPVGRILRKYRLDELPQLNNVIKGDMNIVGPRPEQPEIFMRLREHIDEYGTRQRVKPGITGWAQVNQGYDRCLEDVRRKVRFDIEYIRRRNLAEDFHIVALTIPTVLFGRGG